MGERLRDRLTPVGRLKYLLWRALRARRPLSARLRTGERLTLRPPPATDLATANEVFVQGCYLPPRPVDPDGVRVVADLGANVGYSVLHWLRAYPRAEVVAFEPHPAHCGQIAGHVAANGAAARVTLVPAAAGVTAGVALLSDNENCSSVVGPPGAGALSVPVVDVFAALAGRRVDIMKIDIEGAEYPILADPRFADLAAAVVVMEWHAVPAGPTGPDWCAGRLEAAGYDVVRGWEKESHGHIWAFRR